MSGCAGGERLTRQRKTGERRPYTWNDDAVPHIYVSQYPVNLTKCSIQSLAIKKIDTTELPRDKA
jgi:hypothetical protein